MVNDLLPDVHYDQLIITRDVIPHDDLAINGDYGRHLIIPDDVINVLSTLVARQGIKPRLVTMNDDGGVNVHVVNSSGGGGGGSPTPMKTFAWGTGSVGVTGPGTFSGIGQVIGNIIYGVSWALSAPTPNVGSYSEANSIGIQVAGGSPTMLLAASVFWNVAAASDKVVSVGSMFFATPMDVTGTFGEQHVQPYYGGSATIIGSLVLYTSIP